MPGKIAVAHHSLTDWDFELGAQYRSLSSVQFISPPTSLLYIKDGGWVMSVALCRIPGTQCLPQGEIRNWYYTGLSTITPACFRNQAVLGSADRENCYYITVYPDTARLRRIIGGAGIEVDSTPCYGAQLEWVHHRFFWYNGKTPGDVPALCVDVYLDVAGEWVKQGSTMYDTDNVFKDSEINRAGFFPQAGGSSPSYWDDTEIWGPV